MTGSLRPTARNPLGIVLMGGLILAFLVLGVGSGGRFPNIFSGAAGDSVVAAGSHRLTARDFRRVFDQQRQHLEEQAQQPVTVQMMVQNGYDQGIFNALVQDQAQKEFLKNSGIVPATALVNDEVKKLPWAFDRVSGKFDEKQYVQTLATQGLTPQMELGELTDELSSQHFQFALAAGYKVPRIYAALSAISGLEGRDVSYFVLDPNFLPRPPVPNDQQLSAFMQEHKTELMQPERRIITLVRFSAKDLEPAVKPDQEAVTRELASKITTLTTPEKRSLVQLPVKSAAQGAAVTKRLAKGDDPAQVAKSLGIEPIYYADKPQSAIADRKLAAAAFSLPTGTTSVPMVGDLGLAVIKVLSITPGVQADLKTARAQIEAEVRSKTAQGQAYDLSEKYSQAHQGGANLVDSAKAAGVPTQTFGPVSADGKNSDAKPNPLLNDKVVKSAFQHASGEESDIEDAGPGEYYALKVERVIAPALPPIAEKRADLIQFYAHVKLVEAIKAKADDLMAQARKDGNLDKAAASVGAHVVHQAGMQRVKAKSYQSLGDQFLQGVFGSKPGAVFAAGAQNSVYVAKLDAVRLGDVGQTSMLLEGIRDQVTQGYLRDLQGTFRSAAQRQIKASGNLLRARQAIGVDAAAAGSAASKPAHAAK